MINTNEKQNNRFKIECAGNCVKGDYREKNEDNLYIHGKYLDLEHIGNNTLVIGTVKEGEIDAHPELMAVFDGMGGGEYGDIASYEAAKCCDEYMQSAKEKPWDDPSLALENLCREINRRIHDEQIRREASLMGSTIAALCFYKGKLWSCNVGDSRCYRVRDGVIEKLSEDHVEEMYFIDRINRNWKPGLIQYLGMDPEEIILEPSISCCDVKAQDTYLICSDGLTDMVAEADIVSIINDSKDAEDTVTRLVDMALENGGIDNVTVIVCKF